MFGDNGNDIAFLGAGDDVFQWDPGDGNDTIEGQDGTDMLLFFGSNVSENVNIFANGGRVLLLPRRRQRHDGPERRRSRSTSARWAAPTTSWSAISAARTSPEVDIDLRGPNGGADGAADTVTVNATNGADVFGVAGDAGGVSVFGLQADGEHLLQRRGNDRLTLNGQGGDDVINATSLEADGMHC